MTYSKQDGRALLRDTLYKAQMSSHAFNNAIAANNIIKKWVAASAAVKTAMKQQANANYEKAKTAYSTAKVRYEWANSWLQPIWYGTYAQKKENYKIAKKNFESLDKHRK